MSVSDVRAEQRRARVRELREDGVSVRKIAARLGVSLSTVARDLRVLAPAILPAPPGSAGPENVRALKHGLRSERAIAPLREEHARVLAVRYSWVDPGLRATEAQRRAMIELASDWIDLQGTVVKDDQGRIYDAADKLSKWLESSERWIERIERERSERSQHDALAEYLTAEASEQDSTPNSTLIGEVANG